MSDEIPERLKEKLHYAMGAYGTAAWKVIEDDVARALLDARNEERNLCEQAALSALCKEPIQGDKSKPDQGFGHAFNNGVRAAVERIQQLKGPDDER